MLELEELNDELKLDEVDERELLLPHHGMETQPPLRNMPSLNVLMCVSICF